MRKPTRTDRTLVHLVQVSSLWEKGRYPGVGASFLSAKLTSGSSS